AELKQRLAGLPGIGPMKSRTIMGLLAKQYGVRPAGWEKAIPDFPTLADVTTPEELEEYQAGKRAWKAQLRAQGLDPAKFTPPSRKPRDDPAGHAAPDQRLRRRGRPHRQGRSHGAVRQQRLHRARRGARRVT